MILGIETSTPVTSVALRAPDGSVTVRASELPRGHVEFLMPAIRELCADTGVALRDLTGVAVGIGPGLFTGMRVGIQTAKTLGQVLGVPLAGVCSLDVLATGAGQGERTVCACIDARRGEVFAATYRAGARTDEPRALTAEALRDELSAPAEPILFVGDGAAAYRETLATLPGAHFVEADRNHPSAAVLVGMAVSLIEAGDLPDPAALEPLYVRRSDAEIRWEQRGVTIQRPHRVKIPKRATTR